MWHWGKKVLSARAMMPAMQSLGVSRMGKWPFVNGLLIDFKKFLSISSSCCAWGRLDMWLPGAGKREVIEENLAIRTAWTSLSSRCLILADAPPAMRSPVHADKSSTCSTEGHGETTAAVHFFPPAFVRRFLLKCGLLLLNYLVFSWVISNLHVWT